MPYSPNTCVNPMALAAVNPLSLQTTNPMSRLQNFAIGLVMAALGVTALLYVIPVDHVIRVVAMMALGSLSAIGALVFLVFAFGDRDYES
jgi:hypothetical protein